MRFHAIYPLIHAFDRFRLALGSRWLTIPLGVLASCLIVLSSYLWIADPDSKIGGLGPEFIGPAATSLFLMVIRKSR